MSIPIIRQLMLHILQSCLTQKLSIIVPSKYLTHSASHSHNKCISYCLIFNQYQLRLRRKRHFTDKVTALLLYHLIHHQPFEIYILSSFPTQYRSVIANNALGIVECRLVFYEPVSTTFNQIYRILIPLSLRNTIFSFFTCFLR